MEWFYIRMGTTEEATVFGNYPIGNAVSCAWISIGNLWMFGGLLAMMKKVQ